MSGVDEILENAGKRLEVDCKCWHNAGIEWYSWPQSWSDTSCGFGGLAGQMVTTAQTLVVVDNGWNREAKALVYIAGRFAYSTPLTRKTIKAIAARRMPGRIHRGRLRDD